MNYVQIVVVLLACLASDIVSGYVPLDQQCLGCICEAIGGCNSRKSCVGDVCGPYKLTFPFWVDGGKLTVDDKSSESSSAESDTKEYKNCAGDMQCAAMTMQGYMNRYQQDCNADGRVNCDDFAAIYKFGPNGCRGLPLPEPFGNRYKQCRNRIG